MFARSPFGRVPRCCWKRDGDLRGGRRTEYVCKAQAPRAAPVKEGRAGGDGDSADLDVLGVGSMGPALEFGFPLASSRSKICQGCRLDTGRPNMMNGEGDQRHDCHRGGTKVGTALLPKRKVSGGEIRLNGETKTTSLLPQTESTRLGRAEKRGWRLLHTHGAVVEQEKVLAQPALCPFCRRRPRPFSQCPSPSATPWGGGGRGRARQGSTHET